MYTKDLLDTCPYTTSVSLFQKLVSKFVINSLLKVFSAISAAAAKTWDSYVILTSQTKINFQQNWTHILFSRKPTTFKVVSYKIINSYDI